MREEDEEKARAIAGSDLEATLRRQIAGKEALKSEERRVEEEQREYVRQLCENLQKEEALRLERERKKKEELKRDLEDQLEKARMCQAERASKEAAMERTFRDLIEKELAMEKDGVKTLSNDLRREQLAYLTSLQVTKIQIRIFKLISNICLFSWSIHMYMLSYTGIFHNVDNFFKKE